MTISKHYRKVVKLPPPKGMSQAKVDAAIRKVMQLQQEGKLPKIKARPTHLHAPD